MGGEVWAGELSSPCSGRAWPRPSLCTAAHRPPRCLRHLCSRGQSWSHASFESSFSVAGTTTLLSWGMNLDPQFFPLSLPTPGPTGHQAIRCWLVNSPGASPLPPPPQAHRPFTSQFPPLTACGFLILFVMCPFFFSLEIVLISVTFCGNLEDPPLDSSYLEDF